MSEATEATKPHPHAPKFGKVKHKSRLMGAKVGDHGFIATSQSLVEGKGTVRITVEIMDAPTADRDAVAAKYEAVSGAVGSGECFASDMATVLEDMAAFHRALVVA